MLSKNNLLMVPVQWMGILLVNIPPVKVFMVYNFYCDGKYTKRLGWLTALLEYFDLNICETDFDFRNILKQFLEPRKPLWIC